MPLYAQVKESLRRQILEGHYPVHAKLPTEAELTQIFQVSRITVRQALTDLQQEGLLFKINGKGSFVAKPKTRLDVSVLRGFAEATASLGYVTHAHLLDIQEQSAGPEEARHLRLTKNAPVTCMRRLRYLQQDPISYDITFVRPDLGRVMAKADLQTRDALSILENEGGLNVVKARESIEAMLSDSELSRHLQIAEGAPVLHIQRTMYAADGTPVLYEKLFYPGAQFRYGFDRKRRPQKA